MEKSSSDIRLIRTVYVERFGKDAWTRAVELANRHSARAAKDWGLVDHWSATEWLDLCAQTDFGCARCGGKVPPTPHHRIQLSACGPNTIDNIEPLCGDCHNAIPILDGFRDVGAVWLADQQRLYEIWKVGELVRPYAYTGNLRGLGVIAKVIPPELGLGRLYGRLISEANLSARQQWGPCHLTSNEVIAASGVQPSVQTRHVATQVFVRVPGGEILYSVSPRTLVRIDPVAAKSEAQKWIARQNRLMAKFHIGDAITRRAGYWSQGMIVEIAPYSNMKLTGFIGEDQPPIMPANWMPGTEAQAKVSWKYGGKRKRPNKESWISFARLKLAD